MNLAVPPDPEGKGVKLEDCLEDYFNTKVDVLRDSSVDKKSIEKFHATPTSAMSPWSLTPIASPIEEAEMSMFSEAKPGLKPAEPAKASGETDASQSIEAASSSSVSSVNTRGGTSLNPRDTLRLVPPEDGTEKSQERAETASEVGDHDPAPLHRRWTTSDPYLSSTLSDAASSSSTDPRRSINGRQRSASIIQRISLTEARPANVQTSSLLQQFKRQGSTVIKAVTIPAWQFFRLIRMSHVQSPISNCFLSDLIIIAWHAASDSEPVNDVEVARQFNKRPVVGICLKRYMMTNGGKFQRQNTYIDIPNSLRLPSFMMAADGHTEGPSELNTEYKLVLQSVVCHRGASLHSGHYISFARVNPKTLTENRRHDHDPPPDYEEEQWVKFDDLEVEHRVSYVDDIKAALKDEMPYLLFYQIMPMIDQAPTSADDTEDNRPPSYSDSTSNVGWTKTPKTPKTPKTSGDLEFNQSEVDLLDPGTAAGTSSSLNPSVCGGSTTTGPSIRLSSELEQPPSISLDEDANGSSYVLRAGRKSEGMSRRESLIFPDSVSSTPAITPEGGRSPIVAPRVFPEETTAQRFSRAAARLTGKSRSRPVSQAGEGRISLTMTRLGGLMRPSKEPLRQSEDSLDSGGLGPSPLISTTNLSAMSPSGVAPVDSLLPPNPILANVVSAPAAYPSGEKTATTWSVDSLTQGLLAPSVQQQKDGQVQADDGHHHHHHHHGLRRGKAKIRTERDSDEEIDGSVAGKGKEAEKEKVRIKSRMNVPERECVVM